MNTVLRRKPVLQRPVLVLNKSWIAVAVVSVQKAIYLLNKKEDDGQPKARVVEISPDNNGASLYDWADWADWSQMVFDELKQEDPKIRTVRQDYKVPEIIVLTRHNKMPQQRVNFSRRTIHRRDGFRCQYCNKKTEELTIDHIIPRSQGGPTTWENCVCCCVECNSKKANRTPEEANMVLLSVPVKPKFTLPAAKYRIKSWEAVLGAAYWEVELTNDNKD